MVRKWEEEELREDGVVKGKAWPAIIAGACGVGIILTIVLVAIFG